MSDKPSVLILGGLNTYSRQFACFFLPEDGSPLVSHLRLADKFSINPPTTYLGSDFRNVIQNPLLEYRQANLTIPATASRIFDPPEGKAPYSYVFDLTGELRHDRPDKVQIQQTLCISRLIGEEAQRRGVKAYVRITHPFYECPEKGIHDEVEAVKPMGICGTWWHETLRVLADMGDLNLVILRPGLIYGPYVESGIIPTTMTVAAVYGYMGKPMKGLWAPGKNAMNTVHVADVVAAAYALAVWMSKTGRKEANAIAGEAILPNDKSRTKAGEDRNLPSAGKKLIAPLFNIVDDSESTLVSIGTELCGMFGTAFGFHDIFFMTMAKMKKLSTSIIEEINEEHVGGWTQMLTSANPPIQNTPLTAYMDESVLQKISIAFNANKIKNVVGYQLKYPKFSQEALKDVVNRWKAEGSWPNVQRQ